MTRKKDVLPKRLLTEKAPFEPGKGLVADLDHPGMLPEYYSFRGRDQMGLATRQRLSEVGLEEVAGELEERSQLSTTGDRIELFSEIMKHLT